MWRKLHCHEKLHVHQWYESTLVYWFPLMVNLDSVSATIPPPPCIYSIFGPHPSSMIIYINTISVLKNYMWGFHCKYTFLFVDLII